MKRVALLGCMLLGLVAFCAALNSAEMHIPQQAPAETAVAATVVINAPVQSAIGQLVTLDVSKSVGAQFNWQVVPSTPDFRVFDNGQTAVFSARTGGSYMFIVGCAKGDTVDVKTHTITVAGGDSTSPVNVFATKVPQWCSGITSATKRDEVLKLAQSFASVAESAKTGMTPNAMVQATTQSNLKALGAASLKNWTPFFVNLQAELKTLDDAGKLPDTDAHIKTWEQVAEALKEYANTIE